MKWNSNKVKKRQKEGQKKGQHKGALSKNKEGKKRARKWGKAKREEGRKEAKKKSPAVRTETIRDNHFQRVFFPEKKNLIKMQYGPEQLRYRYWASHLSVAHLLKLLTRLLAPHSQTSNLVGKWMIRFLFLLCFSPLWTIVPGGKTW